ncbi:MAG: hypothetical protein ACLFTH_00395 [Candidatus Woesearchaeota archaeon]
MDFISRLKNVYITTAAITMLSSSSLLYTISTDWSYQNKLEEQINRIYIKEILSKNPAKKEQYSLRKDHLKEKLDDSVEKTSDKSKQLLELSLVMGTAAYLSEKKYSAYKMSLANQDPEKS